MKETTYCTEIKAKIYVYQCMYLFRISVTKQKIDLFISMYYLTPSACCYHTSVAVVYVVCASGCEREREIYGEKHNCSLQERGVGQNIEWHFVENMIKSIHLKSPLD
jgi:hypothetical protein